MSNLLSRVGECASHRCNDTPEEMTIPKEGVGLASISLHGVVWCMWQCEKLYDRRTQLEVHCPVDTMSMQRENVRMRGSMHENKERAL